MDEKEKPVEGEKEKVIIEKIVEVEKPLSKEDKERILYIYKRRKSAIYFGYTLIAISILMIIILGALKSYGAIAGAFGLVISVPFTIVARYLCKDEYKKVKKYLDESSENNKEENE